MSTDKHFDLVKTIKSIASHGPTHKKAAMLLEAVWRFSALCLVEREGMENLRLGLAVCPGGELFQLDEDLLTITALFVDEDQSRDVSLSVCIEEVTKGRLHMNAAVVVSDSNWILDEECGTLLRKFGRYCDALGTLNAGINAILKVRDSHRLERCLKSEASFVEALCWADSRFSRRSRQAN